MIYVCVAAKDNAGTVGLLLWKIRQVFGESTREYQLLVADDGSTDETPDVLQRYQRALPLTVVRPASSGAAASFAALLQEAIRRSDRLKRDTAVLIPGDFRLSPDGVPELLRRIESGADLVVAETPVEGLPWAWRFLRRLTPWLLRPNVRVAGVRDFLSGCLAVRLVSARGALRDHADGLPVETDGLAARAELVIRLAAAARQIATVPLPPLGAPTAPATGAFALAMRLRRLGRTLRLPSAPPKTSGVDAPAPT
ncbi:MAG: glycosyltransferase, partial [Gemmatimonadota bacterium]|nr:glycosyltransferase [Gemmatimonadota bacterium]